MQRLLAVLFWSVISAAFIGPGTVTTAASAGAGYGFTLVWALAFSTFACFVLQEGSARLTLASGMDLGTAIRSQSRPGVQRLLAVVLVSGAILLGCAAYEAGNLLGAAAGATLAMPLPPWTITLTIAVLAAVLLWQNNVRLIAYAMGLLVAMMGIAFLFAALSLQIEWHALLAGFKPAMPDGSTAIVLGLIGTTVVPYNLFLGSGIARESEEGLVRFGLGTAILLGGVISLAVLVVGTVVSGAFSFSALADALAAQLGSWSRYLFAAGLFAAGFSSAVTAPLAAAITARSLFQLDEKGSKWVWIVVLLIGAGSALSGVKAIPAIILAQAFNGILLPVVAWFLYRMLNDTSLLAADARNTRFANLLHLVILYTTLVLGLMGVVKALTAAGLLPGISTGMLFWIAAVMILPAIYSWLTTLRSRPGK